jgi:hypothetical protein
LAFQTRHPERQIRRDLHQDRFPLQAQASERDFRSAGAFAGLLLSIDFTFDLLAVDPCEALLLWSLMSSNTAKAFAAFEDVDAMSFFDLLWCCRPFVINGPK